MSGEKQRGTLSGQASTTCRNTINKTKEAQKRNTHKPQCIKINPEDRDDKVHNRLDFSANVLQNKRNIKMKKQIIQPLQHLPLRIPEQDQWQEEECCSQMAPNGDQKGQEARDYEDHENP